jgi:hypothetical protein
MRRTARRLCGRHEDFEDLVNEAIAASATRTVEDEPPPKIRSEPDDPIAKPTPSTVPSSATPSIDLRGNPIVVPPEQYGAGHSDCEELEWADGVTGAARGKFDGHLGKGMNANGVEEQFFTLVLDDPVCAQDGAPVEELQIYDATDRDAGPIIFAKLAGKHVRLEGVTFAQHTAHHHRPIVMGVEKASVLP